jgi:hypothetical protein
MKIQQILAGVAVLVAIGVAGPFASAQGMSATIETRNHSAETVECRVFWGNNQIAMPGIAPAASSDPRVIPVSAGDRNLVCKTQGAPALPAKMSPLVKFHSDVPGAYAVTCSQNPDGTNFACSVIRPSDS